MMTDTTTSDAGATNHDSVVGADESGPHAPASEIKPGLHFDLPEADYHGHLTSLSTSGAKKLLPPSCPAKFKASLGVAEYRDVWDFGKVVHRIVLGKGEEFAAIDADSFRTKAAQQDRDAARAEGKVPLLTADLAQAKACAASVLAHPIAAALFTAPGESEVSTFWTDRETGVMRRARFDYLPEKVEGRRLIVPDLKTARSSEPFTFAKATADYGYFMQAAGYLDALIEQGIDSNPAFLFVAVEKEDPYVVTVMQLDDEALHLGRALNRKALRIYADCVASDYWPGYTDEVATISLPGYFTYRAEEIAS